MVMIQPGKETDFAYETKSDDAAFPDSKIEKMVFVHGTFDFIVMFTGNLYEIDRRILKMRKLPYVHSTETLIPFKWELPKEPPKPSLPTPPRPQAATKIPLASNLESSTTQEFGLGKRCLAPIVLFSTRGGNTKKVALEIAEELNCPAQEITKDSDVASMVLGKYDMVFIGTGIYRDNPNENLIRFLRSAEIGHQQFALFVTWLRLRRGDRKVYDEIDKILGEKKKKLLRSYFECMGDFPNGHPNARELEAARKWASQVSKRV